MSHRHPSLPSPNSIFNSGMVSSMTDVDLQELHSAINLNPCFLIVCLNMRNRPCPQLPHAIGLAFTIFRSDREGLLHVVGGNRLGKFDEMPILKAHVEIFHPVQYRFLVVPVMEAVRVIRNQLRIGICTDEFLECLLRFLRNLRRFKPHYFCRIQSKGTDAFMD